MKLSNILIIVMIFFFMTIGGSIRQSNDANNKTFNIYNWTENKFVWNSSKYQPDTDNSSDINSTVRNQNRVQRMIFTTINYLGEIAFQGGGFFIEYGYTHPEYDFKTILLLITNILVLLYRALITIFSVAVLSLITYGIIYIKRKIQKSKPKKEVI